MLLGHFAVALAAKHYAPRTSLGTLVIAAQLLDLLWPLFMLLGWEHLRIVPGLMAASPFDFVSYPISHSLLSAAGWAALVAAIYYALRHYARGALVLALCVLSHWFLDLPMHRPDLPLWPGSHTRVGFGLWNSIPGTVGIETALLFIGTVVYLRSTRSRDRVGVLALAAMVAALAVIFAIGFFAPPPPSEQAVAMAGFAMWLFVAWGYWIDRHRESGRAPRTETKGTA
jgi:membrane-bound metal-dependent hydrolase YbcI (DUF457 family)